MVIKLAGRQLSLLSSRTKAYDVWDSELKGFLVRVLPSGSLSYFVSYRKRDGRRTRIAIGKAKVLSPTQARDEAKIILGRVAQGFDPVQERRRQKTQTLRNFLTEKFEPWARTNRKTGHEMTVRIKKCFPELLDKQLTEISAWQIEKWRVAKRSREITPQTINKDVACLSSALTRAVDWGIIDKQPLRTLKPLKCDRSSYVRYLSEEEEQRLRAALDEREQQLREKRESFNMWLKSRSRDVFPPRSGAFADYLKPMVLLSMNTGLRRGEVFGLRWGDVDLRLAILTVRGENAKNSKTRHVPLNREALGVLQFWKDKSPSASSEFVFPNFNGERFDNNKSSWKTVLSIAKIESFRWHDLRHHFASSLVMSGVDLNTVRELLGHADIEMTLRYSHLSPQIKAAAVARLDCFRKEKVVRETA